MIDGQKKARVQTHSGPGDGDINTIPQKEGDGQFVEIWNRSSCQPRSSPPAVAAVSNGPMLRLLVVQDLRWPLSESISSAVT